MQPQQSTLQVQCQTDQRHTQTDHQNTEVDPKEKYLKRRWTALWYTVSLLALSLVILIVGLVASTRTDNVPVTGFYPGIILSFGAFLSLLGLYLLENRRSVLIAAIIFISLGIKACFFCAIIDGVIAAEFLDMRPIMEGRCMFYARGVGHSFYYMDPDVMCPQQEHCELRVKLDSCFCCDLFNCKSPEYYYEFIGVNSCWDAVHLHRLLWSSVALNIVGIFLGIVTAAILGAFRELSLVPRVISSGPAMMPLPPSPVMPPHILYNPTPGHLMPYPALCPPGPALPVYPNYPMPMPMQHHLGLGNPMANIPQPNCEGSSAPLEESQPPSQDPSSPPDTTMTPQDDPSNATATANTGATPNAPSLYTQAQPFSIFEKPPPYAY